MPTVARELKIDYGGFVVGGTSDRLLTGLWRMRDGYDRATLSFDFIVTATTESAFASACAAAEAAFTTPFTSLVVTQGSATLKTLSLSNNTALEPTCSIEKVGDDWDTGRSRLYRVAFECGRPATLATTAGVRDLTWSVAWSASRRRTVTISGVYTAVSSTLARAKYQAGVDALTTAILDALGGTFEIVLEDPTATTYHDQVLRWTRTYKEIIFPQAGSDDDANIVDQHLRISRRTFSEWNAPSTEIALNTVPGGTGGSIGGGGQATPLVHVDAYYEASIDAENTTDLAGQWAGIRGWVVDQMSTLAEGGGFVLVEERPEFDRDDNKITAHLSGLCSGSGPVLHRELSTAIDDDLGVILEPLWTGKNTDVLQGQGPLVRLRTTHLVIDVAAGGARIGSAVYSGGAAPWDAPAGLAAAAQADQPVNGSGPVGREPDVPPPTTLGGAAGWVVIHTNLETQPLEIGMNGGLISVTRTIYTRVERYRTTPVVNVTATTVTTPR